MFLVGIAVTPALEQVLGSCEDTDRIGEFPNCEFVLKGMAPFHIMMLCTAAGPALTMVWGMQCVSMLTVSIAVYCLGIYYLIAFQTTQVLLCVGYFTAACSMHTQ